MYFTSNASCFNENLFGGATERPSVSPSFQASPSVSDTLPPSYLSSQASTSGYTGPNGFLPNFNSSAGPSWMHTIPNQMPWAPKFEEKPSPKVVRFTAPPPQHPDPCTSQTATHWELLNNLGNRHSPSVSHQHLKRRNDSFDETFTPSKQYISEEKMAAYLQNLHISNDYSVPVSSPCSSPRRSTCKKNAKSGKRSARSLQEFEAMLDDESSSDNGNNTKKDKKVILAPELKKLIKTDGFLVKALFQEPPKPSKALVLWEPPGNKITQLIRQAEKNQPQSTNSNTSVTNNNTISMDFNSRSSCLMPQPNIFSSQFDTDDMEL